MAYNEALADKILLALAGHPDVEEKRMFGGSCFMVNGKMCIGVVGDEMMCRIGPDVYAAALEKNGCREMVFTGKPMLGYVYVDQEGMKTPSEFEYWIGLCLAYNPKAKAAKKKARPEKK